jgi:putative ABC transport system ATP-binding protein
MFLSFLEKTELKAPLTQLGLQIARETVSLLNNLGDSDYFFINNPIGREELETYRAAVRRADAGKPGAEDEAALLTAAFRYIPALHKTVALTEDMRKKILWARRRFIHDFGGFDPDECAIDISEIISDESREQTRPVNEDFPFFCPTHYIESATVIENILFGELKTDDPAVLSDIEERIVDLLKKEDLILQLVEIGLDFAVGTKGDRLSGGQRQKIAIARTLLKRPDIYIFDEATASLDNTSQARIQDLIENRLKGNRTVVSVAHRLDTIKNYDTIIVLKAGRIAERGTYDELMKKKGVFYHLAENR